MIYRGIIREVLLDGYRVEVPRMGRGTYHYAPMLGSAYMPGDKVYVSSADDVFDNIVIVGGATSGMGSGPIDADTLNGKSDSYFASASDLSNKLNSSSYTAADVLAKIKSVDGPTSGLDADLLDGYHASHFAAQTDIPAKMPLGIQGWPETGDSTVYPPSHDLNKAVQTGFYTASGSSTSNRPTTDGTWYVVIVINGGARSTQTAYPLVGTGQVYKRWRNSSDSWSSPVWEPWVPIHQEVPIAYSPRATLPLSSGNVGFPGRTPEWERIGGRVFLSGLTEGTPTRYGSSEIEVANLSSIGVSPAKIQVWQYGSIGYHVLYTDGKLKFRVLNGTTQQYAYLDLISIPVN